MKIETGHATLRINEDGEKYWEVSTQDSKGAESFDPGKALEFNPDGFDSGAIIRVFEDLI